MPSTSARYTSSGSPGQAGRSSQQTYGIANPPLTPYVAKAVSTSVKAGPFQSGNVLTATNVSYNGGLSAGGSTTFGFLGSGTATTPTVTCTATT